MDEDYIAERFKIREGDDDETIKLKQLKLKVWREQQSKIDEMIAEDKCKIAANEKKMAELEREMAEHKRKMNKIRCIEMILLKFVHLLIIIYFIHIICVWFWA